MATSVHLSVEDEFVEEEWICINVSCVGIKMNISCRSYLYL